MFTQYYWYREKQSKQNASLDYYSKIETLEFDPAGIYMFKVNNRNTRTRCERCSKLTIKIPELRQLCLSGVFIVNFEHISYLVLVLLLLTLSRLESFKLFLSEFVKLFTNPNIAFIIIFYKENLFSFRCENK